MVSNSQDVFPPFSLYNLHLSYISRKGRSPIERRLNKALPYLALLIAVSLVMVFLMLAAVLYAVLSLNPCQGEQSKYDHVQDSAKYW